MSIVCAYIGGHISVCGLGFQLGHVDVSVCAASWGCVDICGLNYLQDSCWGPWSCCSQGHVDVHACVTAKDHVEACDLCHSLNPC